MNAIELATMLAPNRAGSGWATIASRTAICALISSGRPSPARLAAVASQPAASPSSLVTMAASAGSAAAWTEPLCEIALANRPRARGSDSSVVTLIAPADSPKMVTLPGSPPNAAMLSRTHSSAAIWSSSPRLAGTSGSSANPSTPSR